MEHRNTTPSSDQIRRSGPPQGMTSRSASLADRTHSEESWVEIDSQPSSSSLSSVGEEVANTNVRVSHDPRGRRKRSIRRQRPSGLNIYNRPFVRGGTSTQEEYEESESESDRVMTSSAEGILLPAVFSGPQTRDEDLPLTSGGAQDEDEDDENRTAINYPMRNDQCFTPQPNAFSHPPSGSLRTASQPVPGSYFPAHRSTVRSSGRQSLPAAERTPNHMPQNILSPSFNTAVHNEEALRTSLNTLLSCAAAARGLPKSDNKRQNTSTTQPRSNRVDLTSLSLVPESQLPASSPPQFREPTFKPTIRRESTSTSASSERLKDVKRKAPLGRNLSRERRSLKKVRRSSSSEDMSISPTLLTWVVSAGVVVVLSALSFSAGYSMGKEAGKLEAGSFDTAGQVRSCAREAGRSGLGLKRSLARSAVQV